MEIKEYTTLETTVTEEMMQKILLEYLTRATGKDWSGAVFTLRDWGYNGRNCTPPTVTVAKVIPNG